VITLTISKSDYNYILTTMGIEHGSEVVERIKAGVVNDRIQISMPRVWTLVTLHESKYLFDVRCKWCG
jgi:hypothetical protein